MIPTRYSNKAHRLGVSGFFFLFGFCFAGWASRIPYIQQKLGLSEAGLGLVLLALPFGSFVSLPIAGYLISKFGSRKVLSTAAFVYGPILVAIGASANKFQLVTALFCFGLAGNVGNISVNTQAVGIEAVYKRNILGSFHGVWSLAGFAGATVGSLFESAAVKPMYHYLVVAAFVTVLFLVCVKFLLHTDIKAKESAPLFAMPDRTLLILGLTAFCCMMCEGTMFDWSGVYFKKIVRPAPQLVGAGYTAFMCTMAASRFISDYFTNRYGYKKIVQASGLIIMTGLLTAVIFPYFYPALIGFLLVGVGVSSIVPLVYSMAGRSKKLSAGVALATVSSISFFGFLVGPPLIGFLASFSDLRISFTFIAVMGLSVTLLGSLASTKSNNS